MENAQFSYYELVSLLNGLKDQYRKVEVIRDIYKLIEPELKKEGYKTFRSNYQVAKDFAFSGFYTPIEFAAFEIFYYEQRLPIFPQYPIFEYLVDFAIPPLKMAIELDGKQHDLKKDLIRDERLENAGWRVIRIKGKECFVGKYFDDIVKLNGRSIEYDGYELREFFLDSLEGVSKAIDIVYIKGGENTDIVFYNMAVETLMNHSNTQSTLFKKLPFSNQLK